MKPFHFSLESLRVLRQQKEQAAQQRYAMALTACDKARLQLRNAATEVAAGWNVFSQELAHGVAAGRLASLRTWCKVLEIRWNEHKAALDEARRAAGVALQELTFAARDREALDRFHDKSRRAHERAVRCEEQKTFDELAVQLNSTRGPLQFASHKN